MEGKLLYLGTPTTSSDEPVIQINNGGKAILTSIRVCNPQSGSGYFDIHHCRKGETAATTTNTIAFNVSVASKAATEFLTHPLPVSPGESIWVSGDKCVIAVYGVTFP